MELQRCPMMITLLFLAAFTAHTLQTGPYSFFYGFCFLPDWSHSRSTTRELMCTHFNPKGDMCHLLSVVAAQSA